MKYKVKKKFRDRYTGNIVKCDTELDITQKRADEILSVDSTLIEKVESTNKKSKKAVASE